MRDGSRVLVDTNVFLYYVDSAAGDRQAQARNWVRYLWLSGNGRVSWQVLNEFYANATRKMGRPDSVVRAMIVELLEWRPIDSSAGLLRRAWHWMDRAQTPYWDALILAAAELEGCDILLSEDFQHGREFDGIRVINPFRQPPPELAQRIH